MPLKSIQRSPATDSTRAVEGNYTTAMIFPRLAHRQVQPEIMDQPDLDRARHGHALRGLATVNALSQSWRLPWTSLAAFAREHGVIRVLDLACGGGDVTMRLARKAQRVKAEIEIEGCDMSPTALDIAKSRAEGFGAPVAFFQHDLLSGGIPAGYDVLVNSLFMHHWPGEDALDLLKNMRDEARLGVIVSDLNRTAAGYLASHIACRIVTRSSVVHYDAPRSVEAAFTPGEFAELAREAGFTNFTLRRQWPFRFLFVGHTHD